MIRKQSKKNLRERMNRLFKDMALKSKIPLKIVFRGSLAKRGGEVTIDDEGFYDLDVDIVAKFPWDAQETYQYVMSLMSKNIRAHENVKRSSRVITITVNESGYMYKYDICIKKFAGSNNELTQTIVKDIYGNFNWSKPQ